MCGIVAAVAGRNVVPMLLDGLEKLKYRGYDSAGVATIDQGKIVRTRAVGKIANLIEKLGPQGQPGHIGIAHTRWATHGKPTEANAHPQMSGPNLALVHNGTFENQLELKRELLALGVSFTSETDTEIFAHWLAHQLSKTPDVLEALKNSLSRVTGTYALAILVSETPNTLWAARRHSPLVIGLGEGENYVSSDTLSFQHLTRQFIHLEEGDFAKITAAEVLIYDANGDLVERPVQTIQKSEAQIDKQGFAHYMLKEIYEQVEVVSKMFSMDVSEFAALFQSAEHLRIAACGSSYHAGLLGQYWLEDLAQLPCEVEIASELRYRRKPLSAKTLFLGISQSGETADTLAALRQAKTQAYVGTLSICNVPTSSLVHESNLSLLTQAGREIGVASTKAFMAQVCALLKLSVLRMAKFQDARLPQLLKALENAQCLLSQAMGTEARVQEVAELFQHKLHALFIGRGSLYPIAMEGALKLKEISYIHAEAYPAGELKHGPLALVDDQMPVVALAPPNELFEKMKVNIAEVQARGARVIVLTSEKCADHFHECDLILLPECDPILEPLIYLIPLQLLSYHVAVMLGNNVDQPRNLAKSVTVE